MRNKEMIILKAIGIIFVVMGHKYNTLKWFPIYGFHMALFFFTSGYFYKEEYEKNILSYIVKKIKKILPLYFFFNFIYMIITHLIYIKYKFVLGTLPNFKSFFIMPFINGHQYHLFLAAWFIIALLIVQVVFAFIHKIVKNINTNIHINLVIFFFIGLIATFLAKYVIFTHTSPLLILIRTCFGVFFYYLGFYYKRNENVEVFSSFKAIIIILLQIIIIINFKNAYYSLVWGDFHGYLFLPFITSINGIYIYLFLSKAISKVIKENDILYKIGNHTASVMFNHLFVFFIINYIILKLTNGKINELKNVWFAYKIEYYWPIYIIFGVLIPVYGAIFYEILMKKFLIKYKKS